MALSVDYLYKFMLFIIRKSQAGGLSSTEFGYAWNDAQNSYQDDLLGRFQPNPGVKTGSNTGLIENETVLTKLAPFTVYTTITITAGIGNRPADFIYLLSLRVNGFPCEYYQKDQKAFIDNSSIDPPSTVNNQYYYTEVLQTYRFLPQALTVNGEIDYIKTPPDVSWAYTLDGDGRQVYDAGSSIQSLWDDHSNREITKRALKVLGVSFKDSDFANFGQSIQNTGE